MDLVQCHHWFGGMYCHDRRRFSLFLDSSLISSNTWLVLVGGLTATCLIFVFIASMIATSEADYETMKE